MKLWLLLLLGGVGAAIWLERSKLPPDGHVGGVTPPTGGPVGAGDTHGVGTGGGTSPGGAATGPGSSGVSSLHVEGDATGHSVWVLIDPSTGYPDSPYGHGRYDPTYWHWDGARWSEERGSFWTAAPGSEAAND